MKHLPLDPVVVPDALDGRVEWLSGLQVETDNVSLSLLLLVNMDG